VSSNVAVPESIQRGQNSALENIRDSQRRAWPSLDQESAIVRRVGLGLVDIPESCHIWPWVIIGIFLAFAKQFPLLELLKDPREKEIC
jgi:hypothetical protein